MNDTEISVPATPRRYLVTPVRGEHSKQRYTVMDRTDRTVASQHPSIELARTARQRLNARDGRA